MLHIRCAQCENLFILYGQDSCTCHIVAKFKASEGVELVGQCDITVGVDRAALVVSDSPDALPHAPSVRFDLATLCAVVSPDVKALLHALKVLLCANYLPV